MSISGADGTGEICALGASELSRLYRSRELSPVEVTRATLDRIERLNPEINAFIAVLADSAMAAARAAELQFAAGIDLGPLQGVPVSVKDNIRVKGVRTTAASRVLMDAPPDQEDAPVVRRLRAAGAILLGKTNLYEFAHGDPDPDSPFGSVQNPRKIGYQAGSSSSGSAAAVAAGLSVVSLGTDTGGSVRYPASVCGVYGLKPTYGLVPIRGVIPNSVHQDCVGPLARSVADVAAGLAAIAGHDPADPYSTLVPVPDYVGAVGRDVRGLRFGVPTNPFFRFGLPVALSLIERSHRALADLGLTPVPLEVPRAEETNDVNSLITAVDLCVYHERHRERQALYGKHFLERTQPGREATAVSYARARQAQLEIRRLWLALFDRVDLLVLPSNVAGAPRQGEKTVNVNGEQVPVRMACGRYGRGPSLVGFPSLVVPVGETEEGLPIGIQLVGPPFGEPRLLAVGNALGDILTRP